MYFSTRMFVVSTHTWWWRVVKNGMVEFDLHHDPELLSGSGRKAIQRWIRLGYCNSPDGELGARWQMLMWACKAAYVFEIPCSAMFKIHLIEKDGAQTMRTRELDRMNLLFRLYGAAHGFPMTSGDQLEVRELAPHLSFDTWGHSSLCISNAPNTTQLQSVKFTRHPQLMKQFVHELGHPLGNAAGIARAMEALDKEIRFRCRNSFYEPKGTRKQCIATHLALLEGPQ